MQAQVINFEKAKREIEAKRKAKKGKSVSVKFTLFGPKGA